MNDSVTNAFTCSGPYAILIAYGLKNKENRSHFPIPSVGKCAMSVSKKFNHTEWERFMLWASKAMPENMFSILPLWDEVKLWPGKIVATMNYNATGDAMPGQPWYEGYPVWWHFSNIKRLVAPIPCRGNVGMWPLTPNLADAISTAATIEV